MKKITYLIRFPALQFIILSLVMACGPKLAEVDIVLDEARKSYAELEAHNPPQRFTLRYRNAMSKAEAAKSKKKYKLALNEANRARDAAKGDLKRRIEYRKGVEKRLGILRKQLERTPYPPENAVKAFFEALDAMDKRDYELASKKADYSKKILKQAQILILTEFVPIQGKRAFFFKGGRILVYESINDDGTPGKVIYSLNKPIRAKFLTSGYYKGGIRFIKVRFKAKKIIEGWVEEKWTK